MRGAWTVQPKLATPRELLSESTVVGLIRDDAAITLSAGLELIDRGLNVLADLTEWLEGGMVERSNYATLHGRADLDIATDLAWGSAIVRPFMVISNGTDEARFNLGAYFTNTPARVYGVEPRTYSVEGFDILHALATKVGDSYAVNAGI